MDSLQRQGDELEALRCVYPEACVAEGRDSGSIRLPGVLLCGEPVGLRFQLPPGYPAAEAPQLAVETCAPRPVHEELSTTVRRTADEALGSESLLLVLGALQEAVEEAAAAEAAAEAAAAAAADSQRRDAGGNDPRAAPASCPRCVVRACVWSHHIKSVKKRKLLVDWARELGCGGWSKPGFPGVIVVEGARDEAHEYLARVRGLTWQALQVRRVELAPCGACGGAGAGGPPGRALAERFAELPESGLSELGQRCSAAGLTHLFRAALKL